MLTNAQKQEWQSYCEFFCQLLELMKSSEGYYAEFFKEFAKEVNGIKKSLTENLSTTKVKEELLLKALGEAEGLVIRMLQKLSQDVDTKWKEAERILGEVSPQLQQEIMKSVYDGGREAVSSGLEKIEETIQGLSGNDGVAGSCPVDLLPVISKGMAINAAFTQALAPEGNLDYCYKTWQELNMEMSYLSSFIAQIKDGSDKIQFFEKLSAIDKRLHDLHGEIESTPLLSAPIQAVRAFDKAIADYFKERFHLLEEASLSLRLDEKLNEARKILNEIRATWLSNAAAAYLASTTGANTVEDIRKVQKTLPDLLDQLGDLHKANAKRFGGENPSQDAILLSQKSQWVRNICSENFRKFARYTEVCSNVLCELAYFAAFVQGHIPDGPSNVLNLERLGKSENLAVKAWCDVKLECDADTSKQVQCAQEFAIDSWERLLKNIFHDCTCQCGQVSGCEKNGEIVINIDNTDIIDIARSLAFGLGRITFRFVITPSSEQNIITIQLNEVTGDPRAKACLFVPNSRGIALSKDFVEKMTAHVPSEIRVVDRADTVSADVLVEAIRQHAKELQNNIKQLESLLPKDEAQKFGERLDEVLQDTSLQSDVQKSLELKRGSFIADGADQIRGQGTMLIKIIEQATSVVHDIPTNASAESMQPQLTKLQGILVDWEREQTSDYSRKLNVFLGVLSGINTMIEQHKKKVEQCYSNLRHLILDVGFVLCSHNKSMLDGVIAMVLRARTNGKEYDKKLEALAKDWRQELWQYERCLADVVARGAPQEEIVVLSLESLTRLYDSIVKMYRSLEDEIIEKGQSFCGKTEQIVLTVDWRDMKNVEAAKQKLQMHLEEVGSFVSQVKNINEKTGAFVLPIKTVDLVAVKNEMDKCTQAIGKIELLEEIIAATAVKKSGKGVEHTYISAAARIMERMQGFDDEALAQVVQFLWQLTSKSSPGTDTKTPGTVDPREFLYSCLPEQRRDGVLQQMLRLATKSSSNKGSFLRESSFVTNYMHSYMLDGFAKDCRLESKAKECMRELREQLKHAKVGVRCDITEKGNRFTFYAMKGKSVEVAGYDGYQLALKNWLRFVFTNKNIKNCFEEIKRCFAGLGSEHAARDAFRVILNRTNYCFTELLRDKDLNKGMDCDKQGNAIYISLFIFAISSLGCEKEGSGLALLTQLNCVSDPDDKVKELFAGTGIDILSQSPIATDTTSASSSSVPQPPDVPVVAAPASSSSAPPPPIAIDATSASFSSVPQPPIATDTTSASSSSTLQPTDVPVAAVAALSSSVPQPPDVPVVAASSKDYFFTEDQPWPDPKSLEQPSEQPKIPEGLSTIASSVSATLFGVAVTGKMSETSASSPPEKTASVLQDEGVSPSVSVGMS